ncbi:SHOCT domain-containing protein [Haloarcula sp. CBA1130]|uniref:SHOCT domain-containing protein n=1 Tax=unclassified Haloarcula TaxID=2624677 RepID=UPI0012462819|nr:MULTISPECIES: SHOCT domain-containing protein [unclassified Haloarcula]KAA9399147.1 SHOCT domain-containing protein [Haloarcula sp. CBA1129]KAA9403660.1 SHOCT domain-containing protein [Haloarcula sp. CBA1130]
MTDQSPLERARDNVTELASLAVTGFWLVALLTGQEWWLAALLVGYVVIVPLTELLYGDPDEEEDIEEADPAPSRDAGDETPLERLRRRYAEGELTDDQFERKLERLLETETLEDVADGAAVRERETERT